VPPRDASAQDVAHPVQRRALIHPGPASRGLCSTPREERRHHCREVFRHQRIHAAVLPRVSHRDVIPARSARPAVSSRPRQPASQAQPGLN
jgi:hypothetical protein